uniref:Nuclear receptor domain-containing protein n=1 Tax=Plectus sambesii TaxID=2011161 RepID=A0A914XRA2_9BILA
MDSELAVKVDDDSTTSMVEEQKCFVCSAPSNGHHFGVLSCAACNAFFRRSVAEKRKYACRKSGNCAVDQEIRCICRACRFQKCIAVGMDQTAVQPHRDVIGQKRKRSRAHSSPEHQFSNAKTEAKRAPSPVLNPPQPQASHKYDKSKNLIECLIEQYRKLNERRRLFYAPGTIRDILGGKEMPLKPARVGQSERSLRTEVGLAIELFNTIHPFPKLLLDDKVRLFKHASIMYAVLEKNFLSARGGGVQANRMIFSNFTYVDLDNYEEYYRSEGANIGMDPETAKK